MTDKDGENALTHGEMTKQEKHEDFLNCIRDKPFTLLEVEGE